MDRKTARDLARGHAARALRSSLDAGWPDPADFGYTDAEAALVAEEIARMVRRLENINNRPGVLG